MIINCATLTTCHAVENGETVMLEFIDADGHSMSLRLGFDHAQSIAMTLPRLLTQALKERTGKDSARYVFALGEWSLEGTENRQSVILTLKTGDGFEVSFGIPSSACKSLGWVLQHEGDAAPGTEDPGDTPTGSRNPELH